MSIAEAHNFVPGQPVRWYKPDNKREGRVVKTKDGLRVETATKSGKTQKWPLIYEGQVLWIGTEVDPGDAQEMHSASVAESATVLASATVGLEERIKSPTREYEIRYALVPIEDVLTSHDPWTFKRSDEYPAQCQERNYHSDKSEQYKVINNAKNFDPRFVVIKSPTAADGAPVVVEYVDKYVVMGGNSRAMSTVRSLSESKEYEDYLKSQLSTFGFPEDTNVQGKMLVRIMEGEYNTINDCARVSRDLNESFTQAKDQNAEAASIAKSISRSTLDNLSASLELYDSLAEFYASSHSIAFVTDLRSDGIITSNNANRWLLPNGMLNEEAKDLVTKMLVAQIVTDKDKLAMMGKALLNKIAYVIPQLISLKATDWDLSEDVRKAVDVDIARAGMTISEYLAQGAMFDPIKITDSEYTIILALSDYGVRKLKEKTNTFLNSARSNAGGNMFGSISKEEAIEAIFGKELKTKKVLMNPLILPSRKSKPLPSVYDRVGWDVRANPSMTRRPGTGPETNPSITEGTKLMDTSKSMTFVVQRLSGDTAFVKYSDGRTAMISTEAIHERLHSGKLKLANPAPASQRPRVAPGYQHGREQSNALQAVTISKNRLGEMLKHNVFRSDIPMSSEESRQIIRVWETMPGDKNFVDAIRLIYNTKIQKHKNPCSKCDEMDLKLEDLQSALIEADYEGYDEEARKIDRQIKNLMKEREAMWKRLSKRVTNPKGMYFDAATLDDLKRQYRELAKKHHPDRGGSEETMKAVNNEYDQFLAMIASGRENAAEEIRIGQEYKDKINALVGVSNIKIELIGTWLWVTGTTYPVRELLKANGFLWAKKKSDRSAWFWRPASEKYRGRNRDLDYIRRRWGSMVMEPDQSSIRRLSNPPMGISHAQLSAFEPAPTVINPPLEDGLANLAKATVLEIATPSGPITKSLRGHTMLATADGRWIVIVGRDRIQHKSVKVPEDAKHMYERFRQYEFSGAQAVDLPIGKKMVPVGQVTAIEYDSDKEIYAIDKKRGGKRRTYVHKFDTPSEVYKPLGDKGNVFFIGPMAKPITARGIEA